MLRALLDVPELWMSVTQLVDLLLCAALQPVVALPSCPELVLVGAVCNAKEGQEQDHYLSGEVDRVAGAVSRAVRGDVRPSEILSAPRTRVTRDR